MNPAILREAASLAESGVACALAVVVDATGSVPGKPGATMLVTLDGAVRGTVGGAGLEERVKNLAQDAIRRGEGGVHEFDLARWKQGGLDSVCGGSVRIAIHVLRAAPHVLLLGAGHCAEALARIFDVLDWSYSIVDSRPGFVEEARFPRARQSVAQRPDAWVRAQPTLPFTHAYILGHSHQEDGDALIALLDRGYAGALGVIGSRSKMHAFRERARAAGIPDASLDAVHCPIGIDIGSQSPAEIAVAVAAEIVQDIKMRAKPAPAKTEVKA